MMCQNLSSKIQSSNEQVSRLKQQMDDEKKKMDQLQQ